MKYIGIAIVVLLLAGCYAADGIHQEVEVTGTEVTAEVFHGNESYTETFTGTEVYTDKGQTKIIFSAPEAFSILVIEVTTKGPVMLASETRQIKETYTTDYAEVVWN